MKQPPSPVKSNVSAVVDASVIINLNATGCAEEIIRAYGISFTASEVVGRELLQDRLNGRNDAALSRRLIDSGLLDFIPLHGEAELYFEQLVSGSARETLDDGEAATLALAVATSRQAILDEKKAIRISTVRYPSIQVVSTSDILASTNVKDALGMDRVGEALFRALQDARMRVQERHYQWVIELLGDRVQQCRSLPAFVRETTLSTGPESGSFLNVGESASDG